MYRNMPKYTINKEIYTLKEIRQLSYTQEKEKK